MTHESRRVANQRIASDKKAIQALLDTRRTLMKLVANIDAALREYQQTREEERVTPS